MSTLKVNTLEEATAGGATFYTAKAWVNFNGTGTVAIRDSGNVSSITDNGVADYSANFSNAMLSPSYSAQVAGNGGSGDTRYCNIREFATSYIRAGQAGDRSYFCITVHQ